MKKVLKIIACSILSALMICSSAVPAFAADQEVKPDDKASTTVTATVEGEAIVWLPTSITVSGTPNENKEYTGEGLVYVEGDMAGDRIISVVPESNIALKQDGKKDINAVVEQNKTEFTYQDLNGNESAITKITATTLSAGEWTSAVKYNIAMSENREVIAKIASETFIPDIGARYAENPTNTLSTSNIYKSKQYKYCWNTAAYNVIPLSELGLQPGDEIAIKNSSDDHTYYVLTGDSSWKELSRTSVAAGKETTYVIPETAFAMSFAIADWSQAMSQDDFDLQNLFLSKDGQNIKYLDVLAKYAKENQKYLPDSNPRMTLGHNVDSFEDTKIFIEEYGMRYLDIDITFTKDNIPIITHDGPDVSGTINPTEYTYEELKEMDHEYDNLLDCLDYYSGYKDLYLTYDMKQNCAEKFIEVVMPEIESRNMLNRTTITSSSFDELKKIHDYDDSIGLRLFSGQQSGYTDQMIEQYLTLKSETNTLDLVTSTNTYKPEYAELFDYVTISEVVKSSDNIFEVSNLVDLYNTTPDNVYTHLSLRTPINLKLVYDRYKAYF